jgi:WXG100 family type VII secretion target
MSSIAVTPQELHSLSSQVTAGSNSIQDQLTTLQRAVMQVSDSWQGAAQQQFEALYTEWNKSAAGLQDALNGIAQLLNTAGTNYQSTDDAVRSSFNAG